MINQDSKKKTKQNQSIAYRIFLASPGDVLDERKLAREVIDQIRGERQFRDHFDLKCIAWDQPGVEVAMEANITPQEAIEKGLPQPSECNLVVVIFWSRIGTTLPAEYKKPNAPYLSGTEWEYQNAVEAGRSVWLYRRSQVPSVHFNDPEFQEKFKQWKKVEKFFKRFVGEGGSLIGGVNTYQTPDEFRRKFEHQLRNRLTATLEELGKNGLIESPQLESMKKRGARAQDVDGEFEEDILKYCKKADSLHATLPVAGFVTQVRVPIDIDDIYVPLSAVMDLRSIHSREECLFDATQAEIELKKCDAALEIALPDAFKHCNKRKRRGVVILGDPGAGKTTHLKRLLLSCLRKGAANIGLPKDMLPVFLPLRDLRDLNYGIDKFIQEQLDSPHLKTLRGFGARLLERGNLLFLLDGLDEVADASQRKRVADWIDKGLRMHSSCWFVVTSRFAGYTPYVHLSADFLEMHIRPLGKEQEERFIHNWYRIVECGLAKDQEQAEGIAHEKAEQLIQLLREPDFRTRRVFELARNPLLLANICLVHRHRGQLPQKRARLYEECIDELLEHWSSAKGLSIGVTAQEGRRVLQPVALWLHSELDRTRAKAAELTPHIEPVLKSVGWTKGSAEEFLRTIRDQSGLLTGWGADQYGFLHLGFQEYLTAREIRSRAVTDPSVLTELVRHYGESWWQEVILLLLALDDPSLFVPFMRGLVSQTAFTKFPNLIDKCLEDAAELSSQPFVDLLEAAPGKKKEMWQRQLLALKVLARIDSDQLKAFQVKLAKHPFKELRHWISEQANLTAQEVIYADRGGYALVRIPRGSFIMGSPPSEEGRGESEGPQHEVHVPGFYMGRYPVTNEEYSRFLKDNPKIEVPKYWADRRFNGLRQPVVGVSWQEAQFYASWAGLRLPSEAEWEYTCRAGTRTRFYTGNAEKDLDQAGWYFQNSSDKPHAVGEKKPNDWGLFDMHGNVWEWVEDDWHHSYKGAQDDGSAWINKPRGSHRVVRGGAWGIDAPKCRSATRAIIRPDDGYIFVGFRLSQSIALGP
jgi:formylglycine-generating enzyme required for sulfatase activity